MIDWDDAFDNSGYVPEAEMLLTAWEADAAAFRAQMQAEHRADFDVSYGPDPRETYDFFRPKGAQKGTMVFVHGGYWHLLDKSYWSHFAQGCLSHGWAVAIVNYPLAPAARITRITGSIGRAIGAVASTTLGPIALAGHSAGGHLVTRMACAGQLPRSITSRITRVVAISGVYDLAPLLHTGMNAVLQLDQAEVAAQSPAVLTPSQVPVTFWVGDHERPEFLRQTRLIAERWAAAGASVHSVYETGTHHFDVIQSLQDADGALTKAVLN